MSKTFRPLLDGWETSAWMPIAKPDTVSDNYYAGVSIRNDKDLSSWRRTPTCTVPISLL